jgi:hypothetical protein
MGRHFSGAVAVAALSALWLAPALAAPVTASGEVDGGYSYLSADHGGGTANAWTGNGSAVFMGGSNWGGQAGAGYSSLSAKGANETIANGTATGFYVGSFGRVGGSVSYAHLTVSGFAADIASYGAFGDWYGGEMFTLSARGGAASGTGTSGGHSASFNGADYFGGQGVAYLQPNLAVTGTIDYVRLPISGNAIQDTSYRVGGEYLVSQTLPFAVTAAYSYTTVSIPGFKADSNSFSIGLKYYFGGGGSLEDHQRSGSEGWGASSPVQGLYF